MKQETFKNLKRGDILTITGPLGTVQYKVVKGYEKRGDDDGYVTISRLDDKGHTTNKFRFFESQSETMGFELLSNKGDKAECPSTETLLKVFWMFDEHGLIRDDLCFDPEHFMETVIKVHWKKWKKKN